MLRDRNTMLHLYDGDAATSLMKRILESYIPTFVKLADSVSTRYGGTLEHID